MLFFLMPILLLWIPSNTCVKGQNYFEIENDLKELNVSCPPDDTCKEARYSDSLSSHSCQCGATCVQLGTCCYDSFYRSVTPPKVRPRCRPMDNARAYLMVDRCRSSSALESLCEEEWNGDDDVMKLVPVTSLFTLITYKNYFCFRCHEATDEFYYWDIIIENDDCDFKTVDENNHISLKYDRYYNTWMVPIGEGDTLIPVSMKINIPQEIWNLQITCEPNLILHCSDKWSDKDVSDKCEAYMALININKNGTTLKYKNAHCALCNFEDLKEMSCHYASSFGFGGKVPFSFTHLLDVNRSDGDKVGKIQKCEDDSLWDPYAKRCRKLACAIPGHVVQNGKCVAS